MYCVEPPGLLGNSRFQYRLGFLGVERFAEDVALGAVEIGDGGLAVHDECVARGECDGADVLGFECPVSQPSPAGRLSGCRPHRAMIRSVSSEALAASMRELLGCEDLFGFWSVPVASTMNSRGR